VPIANPDHRCFALRRIWDTRQNPLIVPAVAQRPQATTIGGERRHGVLIGARSPRTVGMGQRGGAGKARRPRAGVISLSNDLAALATAIGMARRSL
jgi:hypothetical protein